MKKRTRVIILSFIIILTVALPVFAVNLYKGYMVANLNINGKNVKSDVPAIIMDGRTLVPLRLVSQTLGADVDWDQKTMTAKVTMDTSSLESKDLELENDILNYRRILERAIHMERSNLQLHFNNCSDIIRAEAYYNLDDELDTYDLFDSLTDDIEDGVDVIISNIEIVDETMKDLKKIETDINNKLLGEKNSDFEDVKRLSQSFLTKHNSFKQLVYLFSDIFEEFTYTDEDLDHQKFDKCLKESSNISEKIMDDLGKVMNMDK